jgi:hypothetical protein
MFTRSVLLLSVIMAASFADGGQSNSAQQTKPPAQNTGSQAAPTPESPSGQQLAAQEFAESSQPLSAGQPAATVPAQPPNPAPEAQMAVLQRPSPPAAVAAQATPPTGPIFAGWGTVTQWQTEWSADAILAHFSQPIIDLGCGLTDAYETDPSNPGNHVQQAALLAAFVTGKSVGIEIDGCGFNQRAKIIGVSVNP